MKKCTFELFGNVVLDKETFYNVLSLYCSSGITATYLFDFLCKSSDFDELLNLVKSSSFDLDENFCYTKDID